MWTWLGIGFAGLVVLLFLIGLFLPKVFRFELQAELPAPPDRVFRALSDPVLVPRWESFFQEVRTDGPPGLGQRWHLRKRAGRGPSFKVEVVAWDPPRRLAFAGKEPFEGRREWTLEPSGTGTRISLSETAVMPVPFMRIPMALFKGMFLREMGAAIGRLGALAAAS